MTKREIREAFFKNEKAVQFMRDVISNPYFQMYLDAVLTYSAPYSPEIPVDPVPHIASENSGGIKAINKIVYLLNSKAFSPMEEVTKPEEYSGFRRPTIR